MLKSCQWSRSLCVVNCDKHTVFKALAFIAFCIAISDGMTLSARAYKSHVRSEDDTVKYMQRYGYMDESSAAHQVSGKAISDGIRELQRYAGLAQTGELNGETLEIMDRKRCGNKDSDGQSGNNVEVGRNERRKRFAVYGSQWTQKELSYRISKYPKHMSKADADKEIGRAFKLWSDVTPLTFVKKSESWQKVDIDIVFVSYDHEDGLGFDGKNGDLGHAFFPSTGLYEGDAHFDDEENWTLESYSGTNLLQTATHELGHSLGLRHSTISDAVMYKYYTDYKPGFKLHQDDIQGIQSIYGDNSVNEQDDREPPGPKNKPEKEPDLCEDSSIDTIALIDNGQTFVFKGSYYWKVAAIGVSEGYPRKIADDWQGLPNDLDAALTRTDGKTYFFKGAMFWRFRNMTMDKGYPRPISDGFPGIPNDIDAALEFYERTYFFKGSQYWRFESTKDPYVPVNYPKPVKNWKGLPNSIDAAFKDQKGDTFFFQGAKYYRFNDDEFKVDNSKKATYPRSTGQYWFDCDIFSRIEIGRADVNYKRRPHVFNEIDNIK